MKRAAICIWLMVAAVASTHASRFDQRIEIIREWRDLVARHHAGQLDAEALTISRWSDDKLGGVGVDLGALLLKVRGRALASVRDPLLDLLQLTTDASLTRLMKRGAMLHTDAAMLAPRTVTATVEDDPFATDRAFVLSDGEHLGYWRLTRHWTLARLLLKNVRPDPAKDPMVYAWTVAVAAHMQDIRHFEDTMPQLAWANDLFPDDARLIFYTAAVHEYFASPAVQLPLRTAQIREPNIWTRSSIEPAAEELRIAESLYRRALDVAPDDAEVLLRLGRVVGQLGRHENAIALLTRADVGLTPAPLKYDAQLFLGREEQALGHLERARAAFQEAARLFPRAQSPQLSLSQLAVLEGRTGDAEQALHTVFSGPKADDVSDPWVGYAFSHLRDLQSLLRPVYAAVPSGPGS